MHFSYMAGYTLEEERLRKVVKTNAAAGSFTYIFGERPAAYVCAASPEGKKTKTKELSLNQIAFYKLSM